MLVCEFLNSGIFWGCPLGTWMTAADDASPLASALTNEPGHRYYQGFGPDSELRLSSESWQ